jgi:hypothetical protein
MSQWEAIELYGLEDGERILNLPFPEEAKTAEVTAEAFDLFVNLYRNTGMEGKLEGLMWGFVNLLHRQHERENQNADRLGIDLKISREEQDGSEVRSTELENLIARAHHAENCLSVIEDARAAAIDRYEAYFKRIWTPASGSLPARPLTAAMIEAKDFQRARREKAALAFDPSGIPVIAFGDRGYTNYEEVFRCLDWLKSQVETMVLHHPGDDKGFSAIARDWARSRNVNQVGWEPDFNKNKKSAAFLRNDDMLKINPAAVILFGEAPITKNIGDKAQIKGFKTFWR